MHHSRAWLVTGLSALVVSSVIAVAPAGATAVAPAPAPATISGQDLNDPCGESPVIRVRPGGGYRMTPEVRRILMTCIAYAARYPDHALFIRLAQNVGDAEMNAAEAIGRIALAKGARVRMVEDPFGDQNRRILFFWATRG